MYGTIRTDDESADGNGRQGDAGLFTNYNSLCRWDCMWCYLLNSVPNAKYWYTPMITGDGDVAVRLKQVLLPNITMIKIDKINILQKSCKKKEAKKLGAIRMSNDNIDKLIEEIHRRDKLDTDFDIQYDGEDINWD